MRDILNNHRDFELADEQTIAAHGRVEQENGHPVFRVGYQTYRLVVLPEIYTLVIVTLRLLEKFSQAGGTIISAGALPERVDGAVPTPGSEEERLLAVLRAACVPGKPYETLMPAVERAVKSEVSIRNEKQEEASNIFIRRMNADANCQVIFATNYDEHMRTDAEISIDGDKDLYCMDTDTGLIWSIDSVRKNDATAFTYRFPPFGSFMLLVTPAGVKPEALQVAGVYNNELNMLDSSNTTPVVSLGEEMAYTCHQPNSITLDTCEYTLGDDEAYTEPLPVLDLHQQLQRQGKIVKVRQRFHFRVAEGADIRQMTNLQLVVEDAENFRYILNGRPYNFVDTGFWRDVCMRTSSIDGLVQTGDNVLELETTYHPAIDANERGEFLSNELESIYIIGDFGITSPKGYTRPDDRMVFCDGAFELTNLPQTMRAADMVTQGLTFYAGNVTFHKTVRLENVRAAVASGKRFALNPGEKPHAILFGVTVNGQSVRDVAWAPYMVDITDYLTDGDNDIEVCLYGSCRNAFGPHHHVLGEPAGVGPSSFEREKGWIEDFLEDSNIWRDRYCFVPYGLRGPLEIVSYEG